MIKSFELVKILVIRAFFKILPGTNFNTEILNV